MSISVACQCGKTLRAKDEFAGGRVKCPACGHSLVVPDIYSAALAESDSAIPSRPRPERDRASRPPSLWSQATASPATLAKRLLAIVGCLLAVPLFVCVCLWFAPEDHYSWFSVEKDDDLQAYVDYLRLHPNGPRADEVRARRELKAFLRTGDGFDPNATPEFSKDNPSHAITGPCYAVYLYEDKTSKKVAADSKYGTSLLDAKTLVVIRATTTTIGHYVESSTGRDAGHAAHISYRLCFIDREDTSRRFRYHEWHTRHCHQISPVAFLYRCPFT